MSRLNPELEPGDRIILLHMDDMYSPVKIGTKGTVIKIVRIPFGLGHQYTVNWDNGQTLDVIPELDSWIKADDVKPKKITESHFNSEIDTLMKHKDIIKNLNYRPVLDYLEKVRKSGLVNMFQAMPFLMTDSKNLHKLIYKFDGEPEEHSDLFEDIDEVRQILINETVRIMQEKNLDFDDETINRVFKKVCQAIMELYFTLYSTYFKK